MRMHAKSIIHGRAVYADGSDTLAVSGFATNRGGRSVSPYRTLDLLKPELDASMDETSELPPSACIDFLALENLDDMGDSSLPSWASATDTGALLTPGDVGETGDLLSEPSAILSNIATFSARPCVSLLFGGALGGGGIEDRAVLNDSSLSRAGASGGLN